MKHKLDTRTPKKMKNEMSGYVSYKLNFMLHKISRGLKICTPKNKKKCIEGYSYILHIQYVVRMNALL